MEQLCLVFSDNSFARLSLRSSAHLQSALVISADRALTGHMVAINHFSNQGTGNGAAWRTPIHMDIQHAHRHDWSGLFCHLDHSSTSAKMVLANELNRGCRSILLVCIE